MHTRNVPRLTARYWIGITLASIFGADLGDFCSHVLGLGHVRGLPIFAAIFAAIWLAERSSRITTEAFYWAAIVTLRTAATNLGDLGTHDLKLGYLPIVVTLAIVLAAIAVTLDRRPAQPEGGYLPNTGAICWLAMLIAGTLGTAFGDYCADQLGLGVSTGLWLAVWAVALAALLRGAWLNAASYWTMIAVVRTLGTNFGDAVAGHEGLGLGLPASTLASGVAFVALLSLWRPAPSSRLQPTGS